MKAIEKYRYGPRKLYWNTLTNSIPVRYYASLPWNLKHDARFPLQPVSYEALSQNMSQMQTVLLRLKQNLKRFYSGNISIDFYA